MTGPLPLPPYVVELLESIAERLEFESRRGHGDGAYTDWEHCESLPCRADRRDLEALRALLPVPAERCARCGHLCPDGAPPECNGAGLAPGGPVDGWYDGGPL